MPDVLGSPPSPRAALFWNGTAWQWALVDAAGNLQIDVLTSGLPAGAATLLEQQTQTTALQLIDNLVAALQSVATDRLKVRGEDQLHSFAGVLGQSRNAVISGAGGYVDSQPCAAGQIWVVTGIVATDRTSATTRHEYHLFHNAVLYPKAERVAAFAVLGPSFWDGWVWLDPSDVIRVYFTGALAGDSCDVHVTGYTMTLEV